MQQWIAWWSTASHGTSWPLDSVEEEEEEEEEEEKEEEEKEKDD